MERIDLDLWALWLNRRFDGWYWALTPHDMTPTRDHIYLWHGCFYEGQGEGGFNTRWEAITDSEPYWDIPF